ncbi:MAG: pyruvate phosphate dikinase [Candidatus Omnitrophica bacterium]|nr:pyruvate phosphate dikinase [Candidatus Omnitrophota bacterium]
MKALNEREFKFGTKAETLEFLAPLLSLSSIPKFYYFNVDRWQAYAEAILDETSSLFGREKIIIRSSAACEDTEVSSMAGFHDSVPDVFAYERDILCKGIDRVIHSYNREPFYADNTANHVLIQLMVDKVSMSGVLFTQDLNTGAPYYVITYDDQTGRTDTVTAGRENSNRTLLVHRDAASDLRSERFKALLGSVQEIEKITGSDSLDIEFAVDEKNTVHIFQVRKIATQPNWKTGVKIKVDNAIKSMKSFFNDYNKKEETLYGKRTILGKMPDWNPAEMIGTSPRPLALSLYRYLITDYAWRQARREMGYNEPKEISLMVSLSGKPYIDVRLSLNSFLPEGLRPDICDKLVDSWLERLSSNKSLHDKIEFDVAITALAFDFDSSVDEQIPNVLTHDEKRAFRKALFNLTNNLLTGKAASLSGELKKIEELRVRRDGLLKRDDRAALACVRSLLDDCIKLGTIPFAKLARHAFIAKSFMRSLIRRGVLDVSEAARFERSIKTVASSLVFDIDNLVKKKIDMRSFMSRYGHLRPGTYNILSKRYDQHEDLLKKTLRPPVELDTDNEFCFSSSKLKKIESFLEEFKYDIDPERFLSYIRDAISAREYAKFVFTRNISDALEIIASWGKALGFQREELSYLDIEDILNAARLPQGEDLKKNLRDLILRGQENHETTLSIRLPYIIERPEDISIVPLFLNKPNFITQKIVRAPYVFIEGKDDNVPDIEERIVLIENADPGFDWIFSRPISGLVTKFGGANSHMAIRCAEFGLPAAIGCGEQIFDNILRSGAIELNCSERRIEPIEM